MRPKNILILLIATLGSVAAKTFGFSNKGVELLRATESHILKTIPEPSDVVFDKETGHLFIVSDRGILFECDMAGKVIRKAPIEGMDFEGVAVQPNVLRLSRFGGELVLFDAAHQGEDLEADPGVTPLNLDSTETYDVLRLEVAGGYWSVSLFDIEQSELRLTGAWLQCEESTK